MKSSYKAQPVTGQYNKCLRVMPRDQTGSIHTEITHERLQKAGSVICRNGLSQPLIRLCDITQNRETPNLSTSVCDYQTAGIDVRRPKHRIVGNRQASFR